MLRDLRRYDEASKVARKMIAIDPESTYGYIALGNMAYLREDYGEAIRQLQTCLRIDPYNAGIYNAIADTYLALGKYEDAADALMHAVELNSGSALYSLYVDFPEDQYPMIEQRLKDQIARHPESSTWHYYLANLYTMQQKYEEAVDVLNRGCLIDPDIRLRKLLVDCYQELTQFDKAKEVLDHLPQVDEDADDIYRKAYILSEVGETDAGLKEWGRYIEKLPDFYGGYYMRAFYEDNAGMTDQALADYEMSISLNPYDTHSFMGKADMLRRKGRTNEAMEAYRMVVELDSVPGLQSCAMYALLELGQRDDAVESMNSVLSNFPHDAGVLYDGACFFSRAGDYEKALDYLEKSLQLGYRRYTLIMQDDDLDKIRSTDRFRTLIQQYFPDSTSPADEKPL